MYTHFVIEHLNRASLGRICPRTALSARGAVILKIRVHNKGAPN